MQAMPRTLIDQLDLKRVIADECETRRNLIPTEPWVERVKLGIDDLAKWIAAGLEKGHRPVPGVVVNARKVNLGTRPVPILSIEDRIVYRALASHVLRNSGPLPKRSVEEYRDCTWLAPLVGVHHLARESVLTVVRGSA